MASTPTGILELQEATALYTGRSRLVGPCSLAQVQEPLAFHCYAVGQSHAVNVARRFQAKGARVGLILSDKDHLKRAPAGIEIDTKRAIERYKDGKLDVLVNVQMVTEGFDVPSSECLLVLRPTMSVALWLQICGRGSRLDRENGKTNLLLLDG